MNLDELKHHLEKTVIELDLRINRYKQEASLRGHDEYSLMTRDGTLVLAPIIIAKANVLAALAKIG